MYYYIIVKILFTEILRKRTKKKKLKNPTDQEKKMLRMVFVDLEKAHDRVSREV